MITIFPTLKFICTCNSQSFKNFYSVFFVFRFSGFVFFVVNFFLLGIDVRAEPEFIPDHLDHLSHAVPSPTNTVVAAKSQFSADKIYDLGSLMDLALRNNPSTRAAWSQAKAASASVGEAKSLYYPWLRTDFKGGNDHNYLPEAEGTNFYTRNQATVFFSMEYILLDFGRRDADVQRTLAMFNALGLTYQRKLQETIYAVQKAYFAHEAALWRKKAAEIHLTFVKTASAMIDKEMATGLSAGPEVMRARKSVLEAEYEIEAAVAEVKNTQGDVCVVAGLAANTPLKISETEAPASTKKIRSNADELIKRALQLRPDLAARAAELKASKEATKRAIADFFPTVKLDGQYINSTFAYTANQGNVTGAYNKMGGYGYSGFVMASWDIFDGFNRVFKVKQRQEEDKVAAQNLEQTRLNTTRDVWTTYNDNLAAAQRVDSAESFVASAKETFHAVAAAVGTGLTNVTEYTEAESNLAFAESELATAVADYSTSLAAVALAVGTTSSEAEKMEHLGAPGKLPSPLLSFKQNPK